MIYPIDRLPSPITVSWTQAITVHGRLDLIQAHLFYVVTFLDIRSHVFNEFDCLLIFALQFLSDIRGILDSFKLSIDRCKLTTSAASHSIGDTCRWILCIFQNWSRRRARPSHMTILMTESGSLRRYVSLRCPIPRRRNLHHICQIVTFESSHVHIDDIVVLRLSGLAVIGSLIGRWACKFNLGRWDKKCFALFQLCLMPLQRTFCLV